MSKPLLATIALFVFTLPAAAQPRTGLQPLQPNAWQFDPALGPVPTDAFLFVSIKAGKLWDHPAAKPFRDWVAAQKVGPFDAMIGVAPADLDRVTLFLANVPVRGGEPLLLVSTRKPYNEAVVLKALGVGERDGRPGRRSGRLVELDLDGPFKWIVFLDDRTLLFLPDNLEEKGVGIDLVAKLMVRKPDGPLAAALATAPNHDVTLGMDVGAIAALLENPGGIVEREIAPYLALLKAKTATFTADFDKTAKGMLAMNFADAATAKRAAPVLEEGMKTLVEHLSGEGGRHMRSEPIGKLVADFAVTVLKSAKANAAGNLVVANAEVPYTDELTKLVAVLPKSMEVARANREAINNLKQIGIAMHNFHDAMGTFPSDVFGNGLKAPAWSWRVQILPYIEQDNLFRQLNMQLPWDHPANLKILEAAAMPKVFELPGRPAPKGQTYFRVFTRPKNAKGVEGAFFDEGGRGPTLPGITDGSSMTFMVVEAGEAVPWYKPDLFAYDSKLPVPQLGAKDADLFLALFADGSVRPLRPKKLGENTLRALITRAGGEVINLPDR